MKTARVYDISPAISRFREQDAIDRRVRMEVAKIRRRMRIKRIARKVGIVALVIGSMAGAVALSVWIGG